MLREKSHIHIYDISNYIKQTAEEKNKGSTSLLKYCVTLH